MVVKAAIDKYVGRRWSNAGETLNWFASPILSAYYDRQVSTHPPTGVAGAILDRTGGRPLRLGVSVGAGSGAKERRLLAAGAVETFDTFEIAESLVVSSRAQSAQEGLGDRMNEHLGDAFAQDVRGRYDLVYWDHALHHMHDVRMALSWSLEALAPGGMLVVNEYVGPTRLQFTRAEYDFARAFLDRHSGALGVDGTAARYANPIRRLRQFIRDPSEAPQSDRIEPVFHELTGTRMKPLGGVALHICAPFVLAVEPNGGPLTDALMAWDGEGLARGFHHFAFGLHRVPDDDEGKGGGAGRG